MTFEIRFEWRGEAVKGLVDGKVHAAVGAAAEYLLEEANRTVPIEEATLARSGSVDVGGGEASISYDTPYAARQHEETAWRHRPGRRAKWLQLTLQEQARNVGDFLAARLQGMLP